MYDSPPEQSSSSSTKQRNKIVTSNGQGDDESAGTEACCVAIVPAKLVLWLRRLSVSDNTRESGTTGPTIAKDNNVVTI